MASRVSDHLQMYGAAVVVVAKRGLGASSSSQGGRRGAAKQAGSRGEKVVPTLETICHRRK